jgi:peptidyl-prolyl cis-trans isomerase SurA
MTPKVKDKDLELAHQLADSAYLQLKNQTLTFREAALRYSADEESKNQDGQVMSPVTGGLKHEIGNMDPEINLILSRMKPGEISEPVLSTTADGAKRYVIYRLDDRINAHKANLDLDYEIFQNAATSETKRKATDNWVKSKLNRTYIQTDEEFRACEFEFIWLNKK